MNDHTCHLDVYADFVDKNIIMEIGKVSRNPIVGLTKIFFVMHRKKTKEGENHHFITDKIHDLESSLLWSFFFFFVIAKTALTDGSFSALTISFT